LETQNSDQSDELLLEEWISEQQFNNDPKWFIDGKFIADKEWSTDELYLRYRQVESLLDYERFSKQMSKLKDKPKRVIFSDKRLQWGLWNSNRDAYVKYYKLDIKADENPIIDETSEPKIEKKTVNPPTTDETLEFKIEKKTVEIVTQTKTINILSHRIKGLDKKKSTNQTKIETCEKERKTAKVRLKGLRDEMNKMVDDIIIDNLEGDHPLPNDVISIYQQYINDYNTNHLKWKVDIQRDIENCDLSLVEKIKLKVDQKFKQHDNGQGVEPPVYQDFLINKYPEIMVGTIFDDFKTRYTSYPDDQTVKDVIGDRTQLTNDELVDLWMTYIGIPSNERDRYKKILRT
jgi:hypothetical protein